MSSTLTDDKLYWHLSFWFHGRQPLTTCALLPWSWAESYEDYLSAGQSERQFLCQIRREIIRGHQLMLHLVAVWYFAHLQPVDPDEGVIDVTCCPAAIATDWQRLLVDISAQRQQSQQSQLEEYLHSAQRLYTRLAPSARSYHLAQTLPTPRCTVYGLVLCPGKNWLILGGGEHILKIVLIAEERTLIYLTGTGETCCP
ncbi:MAG: hypothetical protein HC919_03125 [Oscillatoriales cyanobacterium SM2_2_1]|nr:hypothetical protein [Oscillatoriales cyanobacterium SM2_2_1]